MQDLRGFQRCVLVAGTAEHVESTLARAAPLRGELLRRGVSVVPLPVFEKDGASPADCLDRIKSSWAAEVEAVADDKEKEALKRWIVFPRQGKGDEWRTWLQRQMGLAGVTDDRMRQGGGLYLSLRLDGRIRGSGVGPAPWERLAAQLPPTEGVFSGFLDGESLFRGATMKSGICVGNIHV
jgi:hypothetical protein